MTFCDRYWSNLKSDPNLNVYDFLFADITETTATLLSARLTDMTAHADELKVVSSSRRLATGWRMMPGDQR